ncbi:MAG: glycoside hydrolase family 2 TIM barrel-domain containing protein [Bacteroidia bacterium]
MTLACRQTAPQDVAQPAPAPTTTRQVEIRQVAGEYRLYRLGKPYFIRGVAGTNQMETLAHYGGNSIRTYTTQHADSILDAAAQHGLSVMLGIWVEPIRHGFDYDDSAAVARQRERIRQEILRYKDHPALLIWGIGNEVDLHHPSPSAWIAINEIARMVHETDPDHPVAASVLANRKSLEAFSTYCPDVDLLAINAFASMRRVVEELNTGSYAWQGPYIFSEWGDRGAWEAETTHWGAPIERNSTEKAEDFQANYSYAIQNNRARCLGGYAFFWGQKMERTHTWYSMCDDAGRKTPVVDMLQFLWTGAKPANQSPQLTALHLNGKTPFQKVYVHVGQPCEAALTASDAEGDTLHYTWELLPEADNRHITGGDAEPRPAPIREGFMSADQPTLRFNAPAKPGAYRLFVYVGDGRGSTAIANIPFFATYGSFGD